MNFSGYENMQNYISQVSNVIVKAGDEQMEMSFHY